MCTATLSTAEAHLRLDLGHCYASARDVRRRANQTALGDFCREMGRSTNQGEVGLVIDNVYHAIRPE